MRVGGRGGDVDQRMTCYKDLRCSKDDRISLGMQGQEIDPRFTVR